MAQVTLQVEVKKEQVDKLQAQIDKLNNRKITIRTSEYEKSIKDAAKETTELATRTAKLAKEVGNAEKAMATAEKENAKAVQESEKAKRQKLQTEKEQSRVEKQNYQTQQAKIRLEREAAKQTRENAREQERATKAGEEHAKATEKQSLAYKILGRSVDSFILRMTAYRAVYAGIRAITNGFTEALQTLKAVDDELVTVRKVTGFDAYQMQGVESQAYEVASRYGSNAADYVSGVASFARAGYKELSGDLAELAQKTQIVGDTTADTAQQFLLSVDAAYKYNGSISALQRVLDGANEIDNKYATSIEKIAEGMGIVAPVAAQMHVGVDELAASIGTITAVTQRTGKFLAA